MHHPTDRIAHITAFVTPVVEHWLVLWKQIYTVLTENSDSMNLQQKYKCPLKKLLWSDKTTSKNDYRILKFSLITLSDPNLPGIDTQLIPLISYEIDGVSRDFESLV